MPKKIRITESQLKESMSNLLVEELDKDDVVDMFKKNRDFEKPVKEISASDLNKLTVDEKDLYEGISYTETLNKCHQYITKTTRAPEHGANGVFTYTCVYCGYSFTEEIMGDGSQVLLVQDRVPWLAKSNAELVKGVIKNYGHESTSTITKQEYQGICDDIEHLIEVAGK